MENDLSRSLYVFLDSFSSCLGGMSSVHRTLKLCLKVGSSLVKLLLPVVLTPQEKISLGKEKLILS